MSTDLAKLSGTLSSRFGLDPLRYEGWEELILWGGVCMDSSTFNALAAAAIEQGDSSATAYELESIQIEFAPVEFRLDFKSFDQLNGDMISHFEIAIVPPSARWVALLTDEPETLVYGSPAFLAAISRNLQ